MAEAKIPTAVWSGKIMGLRVHVLDNGMRIIEAEDMERFFTGNMPDDFDVAAFGEAFAKFNAGQLPASGS